MERIYEVMLLNDDGGYLDSEHKLKNAAIERAEDLYESLPLKAKKRETAYVRTFTSSGEADYIFELDFNLYTARKEKAEWEDRLYDIESMKDDYDKDEYLEELNEAKEAYKKFSDMVRKLEQR